MVMGMCLPKFDNHQGTGITIFFKSHTNTSSPHFFQEKVLSDVRSEIHLV